MQPHMENPAQRDVAGLPNSDLLGGSIGSEVNPSLREKQASRIVRLYRVSYAVATTIAALAWGCAR